MGQDHKVAEQPDTATIEEPKSKKRPRQDEESRHNEDASARRPATVDIERHDDENNPAPRVLKGDEQLQAQAWLKKSSNAQPGEVGSQAPEAPMYGSFLPDPLAQRPSVQDQPPGAQEDPASSDAAASGGPPGNLQLKNPPGESFSNRSGAPEEDDANMSGTSETEASGQQQIPPHDKTKHENGNGGPVERATGGAQSASNAEASGGASGASADPSKLTRTLSAPSFSKYTKVDATPHSTNIHYEGVVIGYVKRGNASYVIVNCGGDKLPFYVSRRARSDDKTHPLPRVPASAFEGLNPNAFLKGFQYQVTVGPDSRKRSAPTYFRHTSKNWTTRSELKRYAKNDLYDELCTYLEEKGKKDLEIFIEYRQKGFDPDTGEKLTDDVKKARPWLVTGVLPRMIAAKGQPGTKTVTAAKGQTGTGTKTGAEGEKGGEGNTGTEGQSGTDSANTSDKQTSTSDPQGKAGQQAQAGTQS